jgi:hypothetical protein
MVDAADSQIDVGQVVSNNLAVFPPGFVLEDSALALALETMNFGNDGGLRSAFFAHREIVAQMGCFMSYLILVILDAVSTG